MNTLVKGCIIEVDASPFAAWYEKHYGVSIGKPKVSKDAKKEKKGKKKGPNAKEASPQLSAGSDTAATEKKTGSHRVQQKHEQRLKGHNLESALSDQFNLGRLLARVSSRPGQCGRCDGYILEGPELEFYQKRIGRKKGGK
jgi:small subunit ribosomal protein S8e